MLESTRRQLLGLGFGASAWAVLPAPLRRAAVAAEPLRLGLVGCGSGGLGLANAALAVDADVHLVALADGQASRAERARTVFAHHLRRGGPHPRALVEARRVFAGPAAARALSACGEIDAVLLAGPAAECPAALAAAIDAGKPTFLLGPGAADAAGCRDLASCVAEAARRGVPLGAGLFWRYEPGYRELVARVHAGAIGTLHRADPSPAAPGSAATAGVAAAGLADELRLAAHFRAVDLLSWIAASAPRHVTRNLTRSLDPAGATDSVGGQPLGSSIPGVRYEYSNGFVQILRPDSLYDADRLGHRLAGSSGVLELELPRAVATPSQRTARRRSVQDFLDAVRGATRRSRERATEVLALVDATRAAIAGRDVARGLTGARAVEA